MENKLNFNQRNLRLILLSGILILLALNIAFAEGNIYELKEVTENKKDFVYYGDNVKVSKTIAEGFENSKYIPRSVSINKRVSDIDG